MYERILVPLDGSEFSERVLPVAKRLATDLSLPVRLLHAIEPEHPSISQSLNERLYYIHSAHHRGFARPGLRGARPGRADGVRHKRGHHSTPRRTGRRHCCGGR